MEMELTKLLQQQSEEIADAGHAGWGNTMADAARAIESLRADKMAMFEDAKRYAEEAGRLAAELSDARFDMASLRRDAERYRWLRAPETPALKEFEWAAGDGLDAAIDAAMSDKQEGQ